jgi:hypothetical protein
MNPTASGPARPSQWGNPFTAVELGGRAAAVAAYNEWIEQPAQAALREEARAKLAGRDLACWCPLPGGPCHADVLLAVTNGDVNGR